MTTRKQNTDSNIDSEAMTVRSTVVGMFEDRSDAERAIDDLKNAGFSEDQIGVAMRDRTAQGQLMEDTGTQAAEGAAAGIVSGGVLGGIVGALIGVGALAIPGIGPVIAGGALASAFGVAGGTAIAGAGIGAASGGILGGLIGLGIPEHEAEHFERGFKAGGILVTVKAGRQAPEAFAILQRYGADTGPSTPAPANSATTDYARTAAPKTDVADERQGRLQLREEQLDVQEERVQTGGAVLRDYFGSERRYRDDTSYRGPERRLANV